ncbi:serine/threonine-protein kinase pakA [Benincasa hispida]|uniref:serine/threonine-protein kinase pakA n=1 Tax=Benincasa hispida TaxID=102211 RepID=UPI0019007180|nr:serine/threonine-protein kinase pakA [Benincasa hispida]XP_038902739.1 serine/threonine-protein kinase pakA [Benincasa hispida]XP_038902741.1 serine/threonine-protein kinase pakA [Benincasa hispida]
MEQSRNDQFQCTPMQYGFGELQPAYKSSVENPMSIVNMQSDGRTMDLRMSEVKPVLNYSIQTGEEFAFEFMRDRANSRKPLVSDSVSDPSCASGYMDLKGILGLSTGSECGSDNSMITSMEKGSKDFERKNSSLHGDRNNHGSAHYKSREPSRYDSGRAIGHGYASSGTSEGSSAKMKVLCSFGGKILPRPSDSKLRYVGGETRIIRIKKDISWQELMQKTSTIYNETYAIKYQLPGEDLDALVSVSCDEDLQNMMEECNEFKDDKGSKKLRIFLFSMSDLDEGHFSMGNVDNDSEIQYVVAVNGMDSGTRKSSNLHGLSNFSANNLDEADGQSIERGTVLRDLVGVNASALTGNLASSSLQSSQPVRASVSNAYETFVQTYHEPQGQYPEIPLTQLKGKLNDSFEKEIRHESDCSSNPSQLFNGNPIPMTYNTSDKKSTPVSIAQGEFPFLTPKNETELQGSEGFSSLPASGNPIVSRSSDMPSNAYTHGYMDNESQIVDLSLLEPPAVSQRVYYSERIPRGQEELLNRLSKSDDSHGSQFLISHSQSDQDQIPGSIVKLQDRSSNYESENSIPMEKPSHTDTKVRNDELSHIQNGRNINEAVSERNWNISHDGDNELKLQNNFDVSHDSKVDGVVKAGKELNYPVNNNEKLAGVKLSRPESELPALGQVSSVKNQEDLLQLNLGEVVGMRCTDENTLKQSQLASKEENLINNVTEKPSTGNVPKPVQGDIVIDIGDRFSRDFLFDIFSKATEDSLDTSSQLPNDGTGLSLDVENHEPKGWSYFQNLAQEKFVQNDVSLIDQDHIGFPSAPKTVGDDFTPLTTMIREESQLNFGDDQKVLHRISGNDGTNFLSRYDHSRLNGIDSSQFDAMMENLKTLEYRHEDVKVEAKDSGLPPHDPSLGNFDPNTLQIIMNDDLEELKELGSGTFGTVYHGKWRGTDVAIKRIKKTCFMGRSSELERLTVEFWREADILSKLHHPNVVAFYGVVQDGPGGTLATVTEFMVNGSLRNVLLSKDKHLDRRKKLIIAMDAAFGMEYLHSKNIVHFDLKCDNLLVNLMDHKRPICKVADFGLSKIKRNTLVSGGVRGTLPWMAPELLNGSSNKVSEKVDVFSFGIVLWEILTGEEPYANMHYGAIIGGIVNNTLRPTIPRHCDPEWRSLMEHCWAPNPADRPSFTEVAGRLRVMSAAAGSQTKAQGPNIPRS